MIGVDANILIRLLTADSPVQYRLAKAFFAARSPADPAFISAVTLAETIWVLRTVYKFTPGEIGTCVERLLESEDVQMEGREMLLLLLQGRLRPAQIADSLVSYLGKRAGCSRTVTFDTRAAKSVPSMELLS